MTHQEYYESKLGTLQDALNLIEDNDIISTPIYGNEPVSFLTALHTASPRVKNVRLWTTMTPYNYEVLTNNDLKGHIDIISYFYIGHVRKGQSTGRFDYVPLDLHNAGRLMVEGHRPTVFAAAVSPMDENGNVWLSYDLEHALEIMNNADKVIFEINPASHRIHGQTAIPVEKADCIYIAENPLAIAPPAPSSELDIKVAEYTASLVKDGDCIQLGFGGMPNAVGNLLMEKHDLGIHTEMINSAMGALMEAGVITNARKNFNPGKTVGAFAYGDMRLYEQLADNPDVMIMPAAYTNNPFNVAQNDNMVSINAALQIDLTGQICSESMGSAQFSGTGGAQDFAYGAFHSKGGRGIIAIQSTAKKGTVSKIVPQLTPGAAVSIHRNVADHIVTEYGIARLRGKSVRERAEELIAVAHPDFREELRAQARKLMLI